MMTLKIGTASYDDFKARTTALARGELSQEERAPLAVIVQTNLDTPLDQAEK